MSTTAARPRRFCPNESPVPNPSPSPGTALPTIAGDRQRHGVSDSSSSSSRVMTVTEPGMAAMDCGVRVAVTMTFSSGVVPLGTSRVVRSSSCRAVLAAPSGSVCCASARSAPGVR